MDKLKKSRSILRTNLTKNIDKLTNLLDEEEKDFPQIKALMEISERKRNELSDINTRIYGELLESEADEETIGKEIEVCDEYDLKFNMVKSNMETVMNVYQEEAASVRSQLYSTKEIKSKMRLPKIEFRSFSGELKEWLPFWAQFKKINDDETIDDADKFQYLIQATVSGSKARTLVESFPATGGNYVKAMRCLKERYGRDDLLIEFYIRELLSLIIQNTLSRENMSLSLLYDKLESQLRALETLQITTEKCAAMLMPLVESCLPEETLRVWQRNNSYSMCELGREDSNEVNSEDLPKSRLERLMKFLRKELENEQKIKLALSRFGVESPNKYNETKSSDKNTHLASAASLFSSTGKIICVFCENTHNSTECAKAQKMSIKDKINILNKKRGCFNCFKIGHRAFNCRNRMTCFLCGKKHNILVCETKSKSHASGIKENEKIKEGEMQENKVLTSLISSNKIMLQTLLVKVIQDGRERVLRAIIDTASHRSYLKSSAAVEMKCKPINKEKIKHALFGGVNTNVVEHNVFVITVSDINREYHCQLEVLEQSLICGRIEPMVPGPWLTELQENNICLTDFEDRPIEMLIGADVAGSLFTGKQQKLSCGLVAIHTHLGWTVMGRMNNSYTDTSEVTMMTTTMLINEMDISDLWSLDVLGITDPSERKCKQEILLEAEQHFKRTVTSDNEGRYVVHLPWLADHPSLPNNYNIAQSRLNGLIRKLNKDGYYEEYDTVLQEWLRDGVIEEVFNKDDIVTHYLPHRHVIKLNSTTKIRPVFDASAKEKNCPSLNNCLTKGVNLLELIPTILNRFRLKKIGVIADIKKAFLQISLYEGDRDFLRFLWIDKQENIRIFRHKRVVFGLSCSPFLLNSVIDHHLEKTLRERIKTENNYGITIIQNLMTSFYVDNCVTSLDNENELTSFIDEASAIMYDGQFELRGWEYSKQVENNVLEFTNVLGLIWNKIDDTLKVNVDSCDSFLSENKEITKRKILSAAHRIFDPIGIVCPVLLLPKLLLQKIWQDKMGWDQEVNEEVKSQFLKWIHNLSYLNQIQINRWLIGTSDPAQTSLHVFCDASKLAYAAVIFLRTKTSKDVNVQLLQAKSRVAPVEKGNKRMTIPRLELMAACIGVRLFNSVKTDLNIDVEQVYFWSDSTTVLAWINRDEQWDVFVRNRIKEIREYTSKNQWRYICSEDNPADLPSRGCSAKGLVESRWWEGPSWLRKMEDLTPTKINLYDEQEINNERKKTVVSTTMLVGEEETDWYYRYFSKYNKILRMIGWILRFKRNVKLEKELRFTGELTTVELIEAETMVLRLIQNESFSGILDSKLTTLHPVVGEDKLIRLKTKISRGEFTKDFCYPIVLPGKEHPVVERLILEMHQNSLHTGVQNMITIARKKFWIIGARRNIKAILNKCVTCKRQTTRRIDVQSPPLPLDRIRETKVFEVVGIDLAGPLHVKENDKVWICLFTCAVYRAVHLELVSSMSTDHFIQCLRKFISRRGRPSVIYTDNGTNFVGTANALDRLNWTEINKYGANLKIRWKFNPPTAPWWGGWWERLIGLVKQLLRKQLGSTSLDFEEMQTLLCECESVINSRPLTYVTEDVSDLIPLTPDMFLKEIEEVGVIDLDEIEIADYNRRLQYRNRLRKVIKQRFQEEYLAQLMLYSKKVLSKHTIKVGDIVLIGNDNTKRIDWPLAKVEEILQGSEDETRLVRLKTAKGVLLRPVQRLYPLEINFGDNKYNEDQENNRELTEQPRDLLIEANLHHTRSGRRVKLPEKLDL